MVVMLQRSRRLTEQEHGVALPRRGSATVFFSSEYQCETTSFANNASCSQLCCKATPFGS
jgi:hypothetical protein